MWSNTRSNLPADWDRIRRRALRGVKSCRMCSGPGPFEADHIIPRHRGGTHAPENLQPLCRACHASKTSAEGNARARELRELRRRPCDRHPGESTKPGQVPESQRPGGENGIQRPCS
jgi:5-methylcytosine-specific restriction protein A